MSYQRTDVQGNRKPRRPRQHDKKVSAPNAQATVNARRRIELLKDAQALGEILLDPWEDE